MKIVQIDDVERKRGLEHRGGTFFSRTMVEGTPGTPGNFKFSLSELGTDYSGPRHRHNFDQFRFALEGESDYGQDGALKAGMLGYYPEGVPYGPQVNKTDIFCAVLQFGGASGSGYLLPREVKAGMEELKAFGAFKDGIFQRNDDVPGLVPAFGRGNQVGIGYRVHLFHLFINTPGSVNRLRSPFHQDHGIALPRPSHHPSVLPSANLPLHYAS